MKELNTFRHRTEIAAGLDMIDLGDRFVITQTDPEDGSIQDIHVEPDHALKLVEAIMSRLNA